MASHCILLDDFRTILAINQSFVELPELFEPVIVCLNETVGHHLLTQPHGGTRQVFASPAKFVQLTLSLADQFPEPLLLKGPVGVVVDLPGRGFGERGQPPGPIRWAGGPR